MPKKNIILSITGSIAAYKACNLIRLYKKDGFNVHCLMTEEAHHFITPLTLESLSQNTVVTDMFSLPINTSPAHISLADKADLAVIYPATANIIGKLAKGIWDDITTTTLSATKAPILVAPAMNNNMYNHKILQSNIAELKKIGYKFIGPVKGKLACGNQAVGCLAKAEEVLRESKKLIR